MATVPKPPMIKYRLDFGKALGGSLAPAAVTPVVNYFMKEIINKMLVWPQRIVVPILYVGATGLTPRHVPRLCLAVYTRRKNTLQCAGMPSALAAHRGLVTGCNT